MEQRRRLGTYFQNCLESGRSAQRSQLIAVMAVTRVNTNRRRVGGLEQCDCSCSAHKMVVRLAVRWATTAELPDHSWILLVALHVVRIAVLELEFGLFEKL